MTKSLSRRALLSSVAISTGFLSNEALAKGETNKLNMLENDKTKLSLEGLTNEPIESKFKVAQVRYGRDEKTWSDIRARYDTQYGASKRDLASPLQQTHKTIAFNLRYSPSDGNIFRFFHVEILLNQASDLLDRCLATRDEWQQVSQKAANLGLEIRAFLQNDEIHKEEVEAGAYSVPYVVSRSEELATQERIHGETNVLKHQSSALSELFSRDALQASSDAQQGLSFVSTVISKYDADISFNKVTKKAADHAVQFSATLAERSGNQDHYAQLSAVADGESTRQALILSLHGMKAKAKWDLANVDFLRRRVIAAREINDYRVRLATEPGGLFNFSEQANSVLLRFNRDFSDAVSRLIAANEGMQKLYGYKSPLPTGASELVFKKTVSASHLGTYLDEVILWVRDAIAFLISFTQLEQSYVKTVSLRQLVGDKAWEEGLKNGEWRFQLTEVHFPAQRHIRLRGANAFVNDGEGSGVWSARLTAPETSYCIHLSGEKVELQQRPVTVHLGRVGSRAKGYYAESFGLATLRNCGSFGSWRIALSEQSTSSVARSSVKDIELDLEIVMRATA